MSSASGKLAGKVALVTGASTGIGKVTALEFAREGAKVVLVARNADKLKLVADEIKAAGGEALAVAGDASKEADCKNMVDMAVSTYGGLHVAFNNHGIFQGSSFAEMTDEMATSLLDINLKSLIFCFKYEIPAMAKSGDKGSIIVNSSSMGIRASAMFKTAGVYSASKAGANMLVQYAAMEGAESNVRVNAVAPGHVTTPIYGDVPDEALAGMSKANHIIERPLKPEEISKAALFLASDDASAVTGSIWTVDGGWANKA
ncbi:unnamed protein product [Sphacelaria rigidula]